MKEMKKMRTKITHLEMRTRRIVIGKIEMKMRKEKERYKRKERCPHNIQSTISALMPWRLCRRMMVVG